MRGHGGPRAFVNMGYQSLERLGPEAGHAGAAEPIADKPAKELVSLLYLDQFLIPTPVTASVTDGGPLGGELGGLDVGAVLMVAEPDALAGRGTTYADADLVMSVGHRTGRDEPTAAALVALEDLVAVKLEEPVSAKDVIRGAAFGGGWVRGLR